MESMKLFARVAAVLFLLLSGAAWAQTLAEPEEWSARIKKAESIGALGTDLFGESTNYSNGETSFSATDIDLPGNNALPVRLVRKLGPNQSLSDNAQLLGNWDLDLPYMSGIYAAGQGWKASSGTYARCSSGIAAPNVTVGGELFWGSTYWRMITMRLVGGSAQTVLNPDPANNQRPTDGKTTRYVTSGFTQIRCLPQIANPSSEAGFTGEGFEALTPDGMTYRFDWMTRQYFPTLRRGYPNTVRDLPREEIRLYATRIQDHHGNWVQYSYSGNRPTSIIASDGRSITLSYDSVGHLKTATVAGRPPWQYAYTAESVTGTLTRVTLPDGSEWTMSGSIPKRVLYEAGPYVPDPPCGYPGTPVANQSSTITITHPSGATGQFTLAPVRRARFGTDREGNDGGCLDDNPDRNSHWVIPKATDTFALVRKTISGPGIASPYVWSMSYSTPDAAQPTQWTELTEPDGSRKKSTYGTRWYVDEGKLLRSEFYAPDGTLLRDAVTTYAGPFLVGDPGWVEFEDAFPATRIVPSNSIRTTMSQSGDTYTTTVNSFDAFLRRVSVTASNNFGGNRTDVTAYYDNYNYWLLGQVSSVTTTCNTNCNPGLVSSSATYGTTSARPEALSSFGLLQKTATYNSDGTLFTLKNGLNHTTTFSNWKRGIPQNITYADTTSGSAAVDDSSWITKITDPKGAEHNYQYDEVGRPTRIIFPTNDTVNWSDKVITYDILASSEMGIPAGSWRARSVQGRHQITSYYDALLRPVLVEDKDTVTNISVYTKKTFDDDGNVTFESYPSSSSNPTSGIYTTYDALGRVTRTATADGITLSTVAYLSNNRKQVTDADGKVTTISYQAFGGPEYKAPTLIQSPEGQTTTIDRDVFGKIKSITQSGPYNGSTLSATRTFTYDIHQRPCRRFDPESGSTLWGYDAASQIIWEAKGQSSSDCLAAPPTGHTSFTYDSRGRLRHTTAGDITRDYDLAGNLKLVQSPPVTWTYAWNKRGLLESEQAVIDGKTLLLDQSYDSVGNLASLTTPARTITYNPNARGQPTQVASGTNYLSNIQYWPNGLISSYSLGNELSYSQTLNSRLWPYTQDTKNGTVSVQKYVYSYSHSGNLLGIDDQVDDSDDITLIYDDLHRLKVATAAAPYTQDFMTAGAGSVAIPNGATSAVLKLSGGGGGGGRGTYGGGGGGGGAYCQTTITTTPAAWGTTISFTVGNRGSGTTSSAGTAGSVSSLSHTFASGAVSLSAGGGNKAAGAIGGAGGLASGCSINTAGSAGGAGGTSDASSAWVGGSGGSSPNGGSGGSGSSVTKGTGGSGNPPGGGGGGGGPGDLEFRIADGWGGSGATGRVRFDWNLGSITYNYDPLNNLRSRGGAGSLNYDYDVNNRLKYITGSQTRTYGYNEKGEITGDGSKTFTLNANGQITNIAGVATYDYDGNGKRIKTAKQDGSIEYALYTLGGKLVYTEKGGEQTDYLSLNGQTLVVLKKVASVTTATYLHPDLLGSPRKATKADKSILWQEHYDPFGAKLNGVAEKIGYTGHAYDSESGYTYMQARFYDPLVGRFLSTDPIYFQDENPFTFNRYSYADNNPYRYTDPTGMVKDAVKELVEKEGTIGKIPPDVTGSNIKRDFTGASSAHSFGNLSGLSAGGQSANGATGATPDASASAGQDATAAGSFSFKTIVQAIAIAIGLSSSPGIGPGPPQNPLDPHTPGQAIGRQLPDPTKIPERAIQAPRPAISAPPAAAGAAAGFFRPPFPLILCPLCQTVLPQPSPNQYEDPS